MVKWLQALDGESTRLQQLSKTIGNSCFPFLLKTEQRYIKILSNEIIPQIYLRVNGQRISPFEIGHHREYDTFCNIATLCLSDIISYSQSYKWLFDMPLKPKLIDQLNSEITPLMPALLLKMQVIERNNLIPI